MTSIEQNSNGKDVALEPCAQAPSAPALPERPQTDNQLTSLHAGFPIKKTIRLKDGEWIKQPSKNNTYWKVIVSREFRSLDDLMGALQLLAKLNDAIIIHGMPIVKPVGLTRRQKINFKPVARNWIILDLDHLPFHEPDPAVAAAKARELLPAEFREARAGWSATAGHAIKAKSGEFESRLRMVFGSIERSHLKSRQPGYGTAMPSPTSRFIGLFSPST